MIKQIKLTYEDVAIGAKEAFIFEQTDKEDFINESDLNITAPIISNYATVGEFGQTFLDDTQELLPEDKSGITFGTWSNSLSEEDGSFANPIILNMETTVGNFTSQGLTVTFDDFLNVYAKNVEIIWYRDDEELSRKEFENDSAIAYFANMVENYNKITVIFKSMNMPKNRLKIKQFDFGTIRVYGNEELAGGVKLIEEISPISDELTINTLDFKLVTKDSLALFFQPKQPLKLEVDGNLQGVFFVREGKRTSAMKYSVKAEDYIGIMDSIYFKGGVYTSKNVLELIDEIMIACKVPYEITGTPVVDTLTGYIPYTTCREALQQVLFASGLVADTSRTNKVKIFNVQTEVSKEYSQENVINGQTMKTEKPLTELRLTEHFYKQISETTNLYEGSESGVCENKLIVFSEPHYDYAITNGTIIESDYNYAIITITDTAGVLTGKNYEVTNAEFVVKNTNLNINDVENIATVSDATLIGTNNAEIIANKLFNYFLERNTLEAKVANLDSKLGDMITFNGAYFGSKTGVIERMSYNATNAFVPEIVVK